MKCEHIADIWITGVVPADPLALNWMENLRQVAEAFAAALR